MPDTVLRVIRKAYLRWAVEPGLMFSWLADNQLFVTGLAAPVLLFQNHFPSWLLTTGWLLLALPWGCRLSSYRHLTLTTPVNVPVSALALTVLISLYASIDQPQTMMSLGQPAVGISIFYGLVNARPTRLILWLSVAGEITVAAVLALTSPFIVTWSSSRFVLERFYSRLAPITAESLDANILAAVMSMTLLVVIALVWRGQFDNQPPLILLRWRGVWLRFALGLTGLLLLVTQAFTQSRGAAAGLLVGLVVLLALNRRPLLLILPALIGVAYVVQNTFHLAGPDSLASSTGLARWMGRREMWSIAVHILAVRPMTGIGMGTYMKALTLLFPHSQSWPVQPTHAHNLFLQVGVDLGAPGLLAYVAVLTTCLLMVWRARHRFRQWEQRNLEALAMGVLAGLTAMVTHGLVDAPLWGTKPSIFAWFFMGLTVMLYMQPQTSTIRTVVHPAPNGDREPPEVLTLQFYVVVHR